MLGQRHRVSIAKNMTHCRYQVVKAPTRHHKIEAHHQYRRQHAKPTQPLPAIVLAKRTKRSVSTLAGTLADIQLRHQQRQTEQQHAQQINKQKSTTTVLSGDIRKLPYVTQTDRTTGCRQYQPDLRRK